MRSVTEMQLSYFLEDISRSGERFSVLQDVPKHSTHIYFLPVHVKTKGHSCFFQRSVQYKNDRNSFVEGCLKLTSYIIHCKEQYTRKPHRFYSGNKLKIKNIDSSLRTDTQQLCTRHFIVQDRAKPQNHKVPTDSFRKAEQSLLSATHKEKCVTCYKNKDKNVEVVYFSCEKYMNKVLHYHSLPKCINVTA